MKILFALLLILHGAIHLLGFASSIGHSIPNGPALQVSRLAGWFWLVTCILFVLSGVLYLSGSSVWIISGAPAIILSTILIIGAWKEAGYGMIPNLTALLVMLIAFSSIRFDKKVDREMKELEQTVRKEQIKILGKEEMRKLPKSVARWLETSGVAGKPLPESVYLYQKAWMKTSPDQEEWNEALAEQYFTTQNPAFLWKVNMKFMPGLKVTGRDLYSGGQGFMQIRLLSLFNIVNEKGPKMNEASLQRFLAEMVWFPAAVCNDYIKWEELDSLSARAIISDEGITGEGIFRFRENGDFESFSTLRYRGNGKDAKKMEWKIDVLEYGYYENVRMPVRLSVSWKDGDSEWNWLKIQVTGLSYNQALCIR